MIEPFQLHCLSVQVSESPAYPGSLPNIRVRKITAGAAKYVYVYMLMNSAAAIDSLMAKYFGEDQEAKSYIRHFSAEAFAFLMRKTRGKGLTEVVHHILTSLREDPSQAYVEGIAMLFFECLKVIAWNYFYNNPSH